MLCLFVPKKKTKNKVATVQTVVTVNMKIKKKKSHVGCHRLPVRKARKTTGVCAILITL